jgi:hypothetical protein
MFARTQPDLVWLGAGYVPGAADWQDLNTKIFRAVNGVRGGTWAPKSAPIEFPDGKFEVTGATLVAHGGELEAERLQLDGADTWPQFAPGHALRQRLMYQSLLTFEAASRDHWRVDQASASIQSRALGVQPTDLSRLVKPAKCRFPLEVQDRATLTSAIFTFRVPLQRNAAPFAMPKFRLVQVDRNGYVRPLASGAVGADADGWQSPPKVTSAERWYNAGVEQTFTYVCDQNNVIDVSQFFYYAELLEEDVDSAPVLPALIDGKVIREQKIDVDYATVATLPAPSLTGIFLVDGTSASDGQRVLVKNGLNSNEAGTRYLNGIWIVNSAGPWTRAPDLDDVLDITKDFFVYVKYGVQNKGTLWQIAAPYPTKIDGTSSLGGTANIQFEPYVPTGNKYHSILLHFDGITEMRWQ